MLMIVIVFGCKDMAIGACVLANCRKILIFCGNFLLPL